MSNNDKHFDAMIGDGKWHDFYGVDSNRFKLGSHVFEALEDESDGYRSYLETIKSCLNPIDIFFKKPLTKVKVEVAPEGEYVDGTDTWQLVDKDNHVWLRVGTDNTDDYYPRFVFEYHSKERK